ncbi:hypothetical protein TNCV_1581921 [Trichonephila clavipes]|nr:hypothetical protein TNCV_1581921 [Trichonephila clavipes]
MSIGSLNWKPTVYNSKQSPDPNWQESPTSPSNPGLYLTKFTAYPRCGHARMDGDHLLQFTGFTEYPADNIVSRYCEARRQMVKKPSTGVG